MNVYNRRLTIIGMVKNLNIQLDDSSMWWSCLSLNAVCFLTDLTYYWDIVSHKAGVILWTFLFIVNNSNEKHQKKVTACCSSQDLKDIPLLSVPRSRHLCSIWSRNLYKLLKSKAVWSFPLFFYFEKWFWKGCVQNALLHFHRIYWQ